MRHIVRPGLERPTLTFCNDHSRREDFQPSTFEMLDAAQRDLYNVCLDCQEMHDEWKIEGLRKTTDL